MGGVKPDWGRVASAPVSGRTLCFFDLDRVLVRRGSFLPFLTGWMLKHPWRLGKAIPAPLRCLYRFAVRRDRTAVKEALLSACMRGARRGEIDAFVVSFWDAFLPVYQNDDMVSRLRWHRQNGHAVYLATAALDFCVEHLTQVWPLDGIIATRAEWRADTLTGRIEGHDCRGVEKIVRIRDELGVDLHTTPYYAYAGSEADMPLLISTRHGFLVKPSAPLPWERSAED